MNTPHPDFVKNFTIECSILITAPSDHRSISTAEVSRCAATTMGAAVRKRESMAVPPSPSARASAEQFKTVSPFVARPLPPSVMARFNVSTAAAPSPADLISPRGRPTRDPAGAAPMK